MGVPDFVGFKVPYKVMSTSDALGVCRRFMLKVEVTAEAGEMNSESSNEPAKTTTLNFIAR